MTHSVEHINFKIIELFGWQKWLAINIKNEIGCFIKSQQYNQ